MKEDVRIECWGSTLIAHLACELDHHRARPVRERIDEELFCLRPKLLVLDFSGVPFMDSSGIALILGRAKGCTHIGASLRIEGLSSELYRLLGLSGIEGMPNVTIMK